MIKLTRKKIDIKLTDGTYMAVVAWVHDDILAWHKKNNIWILTHIPTGYKVISYTGKYGQIRDITDKIKDVLNWQTSDPYAILSMLYSDNKADKIKEIINKF